MRVIGLTGGIASGKSAVAALLREKGVPVVDADRVAREVVEPGRPALAELEAAFPGVVKDGVLDRKALGALVFADPAARRRLEAIVHPRIQAEVKARTEALARDGVPRVVYEAALIVENDLDASMDALIVVSVPEALQVSRLAARDGLAEAEARARIAAQAPLAKKLARADYVIENTGDLAELRRQVDHVWAEIERTR